MVVNGCSSALQRKEEADSAMLKSPAVSLEMVLKTKISIDVFFFLMILDRPTMKGVKLEASGIRIELKLVRCPRICMDTAYLVVKAEIRN